jgi:hypothetical protein
LLALAELGLRNRNQTSVTKVCVKPEKIAMFMEFRSRFVRLYTNEEKVGLRISKRVEVLASAIDGPTTRHESYIFSRGRLGHVSGQTTFVLAKENVCEQSTVSGP